MTMNRGNFPRLLEEGIRTIFGASYAEHPSYVKRIFDIQKSKKAAETDVQMTNFGTARRKGEGNEITLDDRKQGYSLRTAHTVWALGYRITKEAQDDNLYKEVINSATPALARSLRVTKEIVGHNLLNRAFDTAYAFGDGKNIISNAHPTEAGAQSNAAATPADLSDAAMRSLYFQIRRMKDDKNIPINAMPAKLIVPTEQEFTAKEIMKSTGLVNTNFNNINVWNSDLIKALICSPYLTSSAWFFTTDIPNGLTHYVRTGVEIDAHNDFLTKDKIVTASERYSFTCKDWRSIYGNEGV